MIHQRMLPLLAFIVVLLSANSLQASGRSFLGQVQMDMEILELRFEEFLLNYKRPPLGTVYSSDTITTTGTSLLKKLAVADDPHGEWMVELFGEEKMGVDGSLGFDSRSLVKTPDGLTLHDPWGTPYNLLIDFDGDGQLTEPANLGTLTFSGQPFLMWSAGPDGKYGTPETNLDNIYSYPGHVTTYETLLRDRGLLRISLFSQLLACLAMTGIIWMVQIAIYPLLAQLSGAVFHEYHDRYMSRVTFVIAPLMFVEAIACAACLWFGDLHDFLVPTALLAVIWLSTAFIQVPQHKSLTPESVPALVKSNWIRTLAWTSRSAILTTTFLHLP